jgi:hypothetical protein
MSSPKLEEVFKLSGVPTYTFVKPLEYDKLLVALRTPGRGVVIEGPSGIGKTTAVTRVLSELGVESSTLRLSARKKDDRDVIAALPEMRDAGTVIIDDFHRLDVGIQKRLADFLKVLADEERGDTKLVLIGINRTGDALVKFAADLNNRIDTIRFEVNPPERVLELVEKGERALKIAFTIKRQIVETAHGSFYLAQMLCQEACIIKGIIEAQSEQTQINISFDAIASRVMERLSRRFSGLATKFASGTKLRREGRAPYLHILKWLAEANEWSISLDEEMVNHREQRGSVGQVVDKGYLRDLLDKNPDLSDVLHYVPDTRILTAEDPQFVFFLRNLNWNKFASNVGYISIRFESEYDFALSFAGADRPYAKRLFELLAEEEFSVFYDENEQHRILAENVEDYLAPIYRTEAKYVVCLLGPQYPKRVWTKFESQQFKERFGEGAVIPIWFANAEPGMFDESTRVGGIVFDPNSDVEAQLLKIVELLRKKIAEPENR